MECKRLSNLSKQVKMIQLFGIAVRIYKVDFYWFMNGQFDFIKLIGFKRFKIEVEFDFIFIKINTLVN